MKTDTLPTRDRLIRAAADLFRRRGYHGVGMAELLEAAQAPKGSLYHHFPNGKSDLALAAASWASDGMTAVIDASFAEATDFSDGVRTLCHKVAKFFDLSGQAEGCPITATLLDGPENAEFRQHAAGLMANWVDTTTAHGVRLGLSEAEARSASEHMLLLLQGGWTVARSQANSDVLRSLPDRLTLPH